MDAKLNVVGGPSAGESIEVPEGKLLIGRAADCNVRSPSQFISGYHCVLMRDEYTIRIRDLGSKNGTHVNGHRIGRGATILLHGDMISIGELVLLLDLGPAKKGPVLPDTRTLPLAAPTALDGTGVFAGDTLREGTPAAVPEVRPPVDTDAVPPREEKA
jgi:pSer/pThr/pTyr-binding forkhead associated (FHA) protein